MEIIPRRLMWGPTKRQQEILRRNVEAFSGVCICMSASWVPFLRMREPCFVAWVLLDSSPLTTCAELRSCEKKFPAVAFLRVGVFRQRGPRLSRRVELEASSYFRECALGAFEPGGGAPDGRGSAPTALGAPKDRGRPRQGAAVLCGAILFSANEISADGSRAEVPDGKMTSAPGELRTSADKRG